MNKELSFTSHAREIFPPYTYFIFGQMFFNNAQWIMDDG